MDRSSHLAGGSGTAADLIAPPHAPRARPATVVLGQSPTMAALGRLAVGGLCQRGIGLLGGARV